MDREVKSPNGDSELLTAWLYMFSASHIRQRMMKAITFHMVIAVSQFDLFPTTVQQTQQQIKYISEYV